MHNIVYVACVGYNNNWKTYHAPNYLSWLEHIISNDEVRCLTLGLGLIEDAVDCIIDTFSNIQF